MQAAARRLIARRIISGGDATEVLQATEHTLDAPARDFDVLPLERLAILSTLEHCYHRGGVHA
jgi:hypothetical protein